MLHPCYMSAPSLAETHPSGAAAHEPVVLLRVPMTPMHAQGMLPLLLMVEKLNEHDDYGRTSEIYNFINLIRFSLEISAHYQQCQKVLPSILRRTSYIILPHELNGNGKSASGSGRGDAGMLDMEMMCIPQNLRTASGAKCPHCFLQHGQLIFTTSSNLTLFSRILLAASPLGQILLISTREHLLISSAANDKLGILIRLSLAESTEGKQSQVTGDHRLGAHPHQNLCVSTLHTKESLLSNDFHVKDFHKTLKIRMNAFIKDTHMGHLHRCMERAGATFGSLRPKTALLQPSKGMPKRKTQMQQQR
ncbi:hypothetical protein Anapl_17583 [Anas platyrhynchos]|uniref:Uncharacterized protein n=1 Tax=Anas platyrhynchos TaxID=8839 RepID=R0LAH1_ANAPL|nr:hypothetical protein Anapl_17583 [Anas platyrhynchos]